MISFPPPLNAHTNIYECVHFPLSVRVITLTDSETPTGQRHVLSLVALFVRSAASLDCYSRFLELQQTSGVLAGLTDNNGNPVTSAAAATAMTFELCFRTCGPGIWDTPQRALNFSKKFRCDNLTQSFYWSLNPVAHGSYRSWHWCLSSHLVEILR
jgi:hypothetical protein